MPARNAATMETGITVSISPNGGLGVVRIEGLAFTYTRKGLICVPKGATIAQSIKAQQIVSEAFASHRYTPHEESSPPPLRLMSRKMGRTRIELTCPSDD